MNDKARTRIMLVCLFAIFNAVVSQNQINPSSYFGRWESRDCKLLNTRNSVIQFSKMARPILLKTMGQKAV